MELTESKQLLLRHLDADFGPLPEEILQECDEIAEQLGYLAFPIDLAGAYIGNDTDQRQAVRHYPADYKKHGDDLLQSEQLRGLSSSDKTVWTVWGTTLERIEKGGGGRRPSMLVALLAHFGGGGSGGAVVQDELFRLASLSVSTIGQNMNDEMAQPPQWLAAILASNGKEWDDFHYRQARDMLVRYSLLQRTQGDLNGVSMHGLVQWRATKYEQAKPWDCWRLTVVAAACRSLSRDKANPQFRRHMVTHLPDVSRARLSKMGLDEERKASVWGAVREVYFGEGL